MMQEETNGPVTAVYVRGDKCHSHIHLITALYVIVSEDLLAYQ